MREHIAPIDPHDVFDRYWEMRQGDRPAPMPVTVLELSDEVRRGALPIRDRDILFDEVTETIQESEPGALEDDGLSPEGRTLVAHFMNAVERYTTAQTEHTALEFERTQDLVVSFILQNIHRPESHVEANELLYRVDLTVDEVLKRLQALARRLERTSGVVSPLVFEERAQLLERLCLRTEFARGRREELAHLGQVLFHLNASLISSDLNCATSGYEHLDQARNAVLARIETVLAHELHSFWKAKPMMRLAIYKVITAHPLHRFEIRHGDLD